MIDGEPIAAAVRTVMATRTYWTGTASEFFGALSELAGERVTQSKAWPDSPRALAGRLRRVATFLLKICIDISFEREGRARRTRTIRITQTPEDLASDYSGAPSSASSAAGSTQLHNGFAAPNPRTNYTHADSADANLPLQSRRAQRSTNG